MFSPALWFGSATSNTVVSPTVKRKQLNCIAYLWVIVSTYVSSGIIPGWGVWSTSVGLIKALEIRDFVGKRARPPPLLEVQATAVQL